MVGPMVAAIVLSLSISSPLRVPGKLFVVAQSVVGDVIASTFRASDLDVMARNWMAVVLVGAGTLLISLMVGELLSRIAHLDRPTAVLGSLPGGASGMVAMSPSVSADPKLVAVMQYVRLIGVVLTASVLTHVWTASHDVHATSPSAPSISWSSAAITLGIGAVGSWLGQRLKVPAGALLGALALGIVAASTGIVHLAVPIVISAPAYAVIGVYVGLLFDRGSLRHAGKLIPYIVVSTLTLIVACTGMSLALVTLTGNDFLTCFLSTSPGGLDSVALLALGGGTNLALVLTLQTARLLTIVFLGPFVVRLYATMTKT
jgi:membrane AbrB-like protein